MKRETYAFLIGIAIIAIIVMNTNTASGNGQIEAAITQAQMMKINHGPRRADIQNPQVVVSQNGMGQTMTSGTITANFGENTQNIDANNVLVLQKYLVAKGFLKEKYVTGEFGPITKQAVKDFQVANNISPATGFVGDLTRQIINNNQ